MPARLTPAQLAALKAAADGNLARQSGYPYRWHAGGWVFPRAATCKALLSRGLIALDFEHQPGLWVTAAVTAAGRALLDTPNPEGT